MSIEEAKIPMAEPGFLYGWGLFETMRAYQNHIVSLEAHLERLRRSSARIKVELPYPLSQLKKIIRKTVWPNGFIDTCVRLTLWKKEKGSGILVAAKNYQPYPAAVYRQGFSAGISRFRQDEHSLLCRIKTTNRILYQLSLKEAEAKGYQEAILLNSRGYLSEGTKSNLFFAKDSQLCTPALECGCLEGVTRGVILHWAKRCKIKFSEGNFTLSDLYSAEEAFLTNSLMGVMPLRRIEKRNIGYGRNKFSQFFQQKYQRILYDRRKT